MQTWFHIAQTPAGMFVHRIDPLAVAARVKALQAGDPGLGEADAEAEAYGEYADAIRASLGFAPRSRWMRREGWTSKLTTGEPHPSIMDGKANVDIDALPDLPPPPTVKAA